MSKHHSKCTTCRHPCATDEDARFEISEDFRRFNQKEDIFSRSFWDSKNFGEVDQFLEDSSSLSRVLVQIDIVSSNSLIEAFLGTIEARMAFSQHPRQYGGGAASRCLLRR